MQIRTDITSGPWDAFVEAHPEATAYHAWRWRQVFEQAFGHETVYLAAIDRGEVTGVLPLAIFRSHLFGRFAVSLPFVNYGGLCATTPEAAEALLASAADLARARRLAHVELRHTARLCPGLGAREHKVGMRMALPSDATRAWEGLDRKVRNQVRKAEKSALTARSGGLEFLESFYRVFTRNMRDLGTPVYSIDFFRAVLEAFPLETRVFIVEHGDLPVAAGITVRHRGTLEIPWASSLREYRAECPNNLLYWQIMQFAIATGATTLDFGRSTPEEGTFQFKKQWGAQPFPLYWEYVMSEGAVPADLSPKNPKFGAAIAVWKRLPVAVTTLIGPHIVRSIP
jgi:FemAB-related protein (PEP-CTERM system-associated)